MANDCVRRGREKMIFSDDKTLDNVGVDVYSSWREEKKVSVRHRTLVNRQCVTEYLEKMDVSAEQCCVIKFCMRLKKIPSEILALLKEAFGKEMLGDSTIRRWHKAFIDGRESAEFEPRGGALWTVVTATNISTVAAVIEEAWASQGWYFEKEQVTEEDIEIEDNESVMDDE